MLNRRYVDALIRRVGSLYGWTKGDHVPVRVGRLEQTALQTGMDHHDFGLIPKQAGVALLQQLHDAVMAHIQEEESQLFPAVRDSSLDLRELALQMQAFEANMVSTQAMRSQSNLRPDQMH